MGSRKVIFNFIMVAFALSSLILCIAFIFKLVFLQCIVTAMIAYLLNPLVNKLDNYGIPRRASVIFIIVFFIGILISFFIIVVPIIYSELILLIKFLAGKFPMIQDEITPSLLSLYRKFGYDNVIDVFKNFKSSPESLLTDENIKIITSMLIFLLKKMIYFIMKAFNSGSSLSSVVLFLMITPILLFYFLLEWPDIIKGIENIIPLRYKQELRENFIKIDCVISAYLRGQVFVCFIMSFYYIAVLSYMSINYSVLIGLISGSLTFIPYIGAILSSIIAVSVALVQFSSYIKVLFILALFLFGQMIEGHILVPLLIGRQVSLHPIWIIIGMTVCSLKMGFIGIVFSIPITAVAGVLVKSFLEKYKDSNFYKEMS